MTPYFQQDGVTLYHGDCREILPQLGRFDLLLTDPPYGIDFAGQPTLWQRLAGATPEQWDREKPTHELFCAAIAAANDSVIWGGNYFGLGPARCFLAWVKPDSPPSMGSVEYAWTTLNTNSRHIVQSISATNAERCGHPTQKPLRVMRWCLSFGPDAKTILDPFAGSGTTLLAARLEGRQAVGIEISERYCEIAANRLRQKLLF